jgi:hypothetical protein
MNDESTTKKNPKSSFDATRPEGPLPPNPIGHFDIFVDGFWSMSDDHDDDDDRFFFLVSRWDKVQKVPRSAIKNKFKVSLSRHTCI